ncbi:MAG TPA: hypothetical protein VGJ22_03110 [Anaerolineales bacterium]|jgi:hypothetical protein
MIANKGDSRERTWLAIWLAANLCVGLLIVHGYGVSFDEPGYYKYAASSLEAYRSFFGWLYEPYYGASNLPYYGPAFMILAGLAVNAIHAAFPWLFVYDLWHFAYFITFQLTGLCLYALTRRWFSAWTAWAVLVLFITQPLLWGHAFINPKDVPFMLFFTLSVLAGFKMVDRFSTSSTLAVALKNPWTALREGNTDPRRLRNFVRLFWIEVALIFVVIVLQDQWLAAFREIVRFFFESEPTSWAGTLFGGLAARGSTVPLDDYVRKAQIIFLRVFYGAIFVGLAALLVDYWLLTRKAMPRAARLPTLNGDSLKNLLRETRQALSSWPVVLAGAALGFAISVRALGPLAGLSVILYLVITARERSISVTIAYLAWAALVTYLSWPFLWNAPVSHFFQSLSLMTNFPWDGRVLFDGQFYRVDTLPWTYLPVLLNIQLTEPFLLLFYPALGILVWRLFQESLRIDLLLYLALGLVLPLAALIVFRSPLYDNFRQVLFLLPAMFVLAGLTFEALWRVLKLPAARVALIAALALPGIYAGVRMHPYQYVYYNSFVGGARGAFDRFEMDYWRTSYRELALQLNQIAAPDARIIFIGAADTFQVYARPDLVLEKINQASFDLNGEYDYAVIPSRWKADEFYPDAPVVITVERQGARLSAVKLARGASSK